MIVGSIAGDRPQVLPTCSTEQETSVETGNGIVGQLGKLRPIDSQSAFRPAPLWVPQCSGRWAMVLTYCCSSEKNVMP